MMHQLGLAHKRAGYANVVGDPAMRVGLLVVRGLFVACTEYSVLRRVCMSLAWRWLSVSFLDNI